MNTTKLKRVGVVGAGPAGLVAAKTFIQHGGFSVTVFDAAERVGGMWRGRLGEHGDKCAPDMRTNLSRFTVAFSDLSWSSVFPPDSTSSNNAPMFPQAHEVGQYLEAYCAKFGLNSAIKLNKRVVNVKLHDDQNTWEITTQDSITGQLWTTNFDYLVIASGFFDKPGRSFSPSPGTNMQNIQHSSHFRKLASLTNRAGKIVVIGGGISGAEAAANAAFQISNAKAHPDNPDTTHMNSKIYHVVNRPFYVLPRYLPQGPNHSDVNLDDPAPKFLPLDFVLYNLSRRGEGDITAATSTVLAEKARKGHDFLQSLLGGDLNELGHPELIYKESQKGYPGYTGITDTYVEFVRSGTIVPVRGWVDEVKHGAKESSFDIMLKQYDPWYHAQANEPTGSTAICDVVGIIEATGFKNGLDYLSTAIKQHLDYDPSSLRIPFNFTQGSAIGSPTLAAVGFYEGPFWGVMEMQARYILNFWTREAMSLHEVFNRPKHDSSWDTAARDIRDALKSGDALHVPQFWMSDYVGFVEQFSRKAGVARDDGLFHGRTGPVFPARYPDERTGSDAAITRAEVSKLMSQSANGTKFVPAAVFRGMQGRWKLQRRVVFRQSSSSDETFIGAAYFHPCVPHDPEATAEYLYMEESTPNGRSLPETHTWACRYYEKSDEISSGFGSAKEETSATRFSKWKFRVPEDPYRGWLANSTHDLDKTDACQTDYEFKFRGALLETFCVSSRVIGPSKDCTHETWYKRPETKEMS